MEYCELKVDEGIDILDMYEALQSSTDAEGPGPQDFAYEQVELLCRLSLMEQHARWLPLQLPHELAKC